jgi:hypothetical protein
MKLEDRIRNAVSGTLEQSRPTTIGAWEKFTARATRPRTSARFILAAAAAAAAVAIGLIVTRTVAIDRPRPAPFATDPVPSASANPTMSPSASPAPVRAAIPAEIVTVLRAGNGVPRLVVMRTRDGEVIRELASGTGDTEIQQRISLSADRKTVYFTRGNDICLLTIYSIPITGGVEREVSPGREAVESPDGRYLAYTRNQTRRNRECPGDLVVRDRSTGGERVWRWEYEGGDGPGSSPAPWGLTWAPDSKHLAFNRNLVVHVLDITMGSTILDAKPLNNPETNRWSYPTYSAKDGTLAVVEYLPESNRDRVIAVDPSTGKRLAVLADARGEVPPEGRRSGLWDGQIVHGLDYDISGSHLLVRVSDASEEFKLLYRLEGDSLVRIADDTWVAEW